MKKKFVLLFALLALLVGASQPVSAAEDTGYARQFESNSRVGFYGSYPAPNVPEPQVPAPKPKPGVSRLPQTGEQHNSYLAVFGLLLVVTAYTMFKKIKKAKD